MNTNNSHLPTELPSIDDQVLGTLPDIDPSLIAGDQYSGASAFEAMLDGTDPISTEPTEDSDNTEQPDVDSADENELEHDENSDEEQSDSDDGEEVDHQDGDEDDADNSDVVELTDETVVKDSHGEDTTIAELKAGNLRQADYTRGKQELADQRKEMESTVTMFTQNLAIASSETADTLAQYDKVDWGKLSSTDYQKHQIRVKALQKKQTEQQGMFSKIQDLNATETKANQGKQVQETFATLQKELPVFNKRVYKDMLTHAVTDLGLPQNMANSIVDAKLLTALHNSMLYTQGKKGVATKTTPKKKAVIKTQQSKGKATPSRNKAPVKPQLIQKGQYNSDAGRSAFAALLR